MPSNAPAVAFNSPGVAVRELDFSPVAQGPRSTVAAFIGIFEKGPIATPTLVASLAEAQRLFGTYLPAYYSMYAVKQFFDHGGTQAMIVRTAHYSDITTASTLAAVKAYKTLADRGGSPQNTLTLTALSEGAWANGATSGIAVAVLDGTVNPTTEFRIQVYFGGVASANLVEDYDNLNLTPSDVNYVARRINGISNYITVTDLASTNTPATNRPATFAVASGALASGADGLAGLADTDFSGDQTAKTGIYAFDATKGFYLIAAPGWGTYNVMTAILNYAHGRTDKKVVALLETPASLSRATAIAFRNQTSPYSGTVFDHSHGGMWYPYVKWPDPVTGLTRTFPPTGAIAGLICSAQAQFGFWSAPAGYTRGLLIGAVGLETDISQADADVLFPAGINPIVRKDGIGYVVMGQLTLQRKLTATSRLNVRFVLDYIEDILQTFAESLMFEPNTPATWNAFERFANPFLQQVKDQQGLYGFLVTVDASNNPPTSIDQNRLNIDVYVQPVKDAEFITINIDIAATGVNLSEFATA